MGEVYLAQDLRLHRPVALKMLPAEAAGEGSELDALCQRVLEQNIDIASLERRRMQTAMQRAKGNPSQAAR
ncbi:hypothetical protein, partial [Enterococcus casseliflavus]|uniref:hypothetical protein n=1 Tax=Enterococcus casseliflavus TaxID=37734 RepID=UPI003D12A5A4